MARRTLCSAAGLLIACQATAWSATFAVNDLADRIRCGTWRRRLCDQPREMHPAGRDPGANALAGADEVTLTIGVHELTINGANEDAAATGDLTSRTISPSAAATRTSPSSTPMAAIGYWIRLSECRVASWCCET